jgi:hypothetical protein
VTIFVKLQLRRMLCVYRGHVSLRFVSYAIRLYDFFSYLERRGASAVSGRSNLVKGRKRTNRIVDFRGNGNLFSGDIKHIGRLDALSGEQLIQGKRRW